MHFFVFISLCLTRSFCVFLYLFSSHSHINIHIHTFMWYLNPWNTQTHTALPKNICVEGKKRKHSKDSVFEVSKAVGSYFTYTSLQRSKCDENTSCLFRRTVSNEHEAAIYAVLIFIISTIYFITRLSKNVEWPIKVTSVSWLLFTVLWVS